MSENALSRAIMVGLALLSGGAHAAVPPTAAADPFDPADLTGLVALDGELSGLGDAGASHGAGDEPGGNCPGPSGCVADLILSTLALGGSDRLDRVTTPAVVVVQNNSFSGLAVDDAQVTIQTSLNQDLRVEGCQQTAASTAVCPIGRLEIGARAALPLVLEPNGSSIFPTWLTVTVSSSQPDPIPENDTRSAWVDVAPEFERLARIAQVDRRSCPVIEADVSVTYRDGTPADGPVPGPGLLDVFDEGQWAGSPLAYDPNLQPSSVVFLLDDSGVVAPARLEAHKALVAQAAANWRQDAAAAGWPLPTFAVAGTSGHGVGGFTADPAALETQLAAIQPTGRISRLYSALIGSASSLSLRRGRFAVVAFLEAGDGTGSVQADPLRPLQATGVPVYAIVSRPDLEPLARRIAKASAGFRQVSLADDQAALSAAIGAVRRQSRLSWVAPSGGEPRREVLITHQDAGGGLPVAAAGWYSQRDTDCARPCMSSRMLPAVGSSGSTISVVRLAIEPGNGPLTFSLRETVPNGVFVSWASDGGVYNPVDRSIRWDGKRISGPVEYTYGVYRTGPPGAAGPEVVFRGALSSGAMLLPTCGDTTTPVVPRHPADVEGLGRVLTAAAQAYAHSWRRGWPWIEGVSPIPIAHLTRAGQIQASGNAYRRVDAPVPWTTFMPPPPLPYVVSAQRVAPPFYEPGKTLAIGLQVEPHGQGLYGAVEEHVPGGWDVVAVGQDGVYDPDHGVIRWGPFQDSQPRTLNYTLLAPADASLAVALTGRYSVDGDQQEFGGRGSLGNAELDPLFADDFD